MTVTDDPETFREQWNDYIEGFENLKVAVPADRMGDVDEHMDALKEIVDETVAHHEDEQAEEVEG